MEEIALSRIRFVVIGGSSGSLDALLVILPQLRSPYPLPLLLVIHRSNLADNGLAELLRTKTSLRVKETDDKDQLEPGCIYIAPPDYHVLPEEDGSLSLDASEKINFSRPSIDVCFSAAAAVYGPGLLAILLSGANADGAEGMAQVKRAGGTTIVQDPTQSLVGFMPEKAMLESEVDSVLSPAGIAALLNSIPSI